MINGIALVIDSLYPCKTLVAVDITATPEARYSLDMQWIILNEIIDLLSQYRYMVLWSWETNRQTSDFPLNISKQWLGSVLFDMWIYSSQCL